MSDLIATATPEPADEAMPVVFGNLASGVAVTFGTRLLIVASSLGASIIVARWLGPQGTGALATLSVTVALALQLGNVGLPSATTYVVAKDRNMLAPVWANGAVFSLIAGTIIALGVGAVAYLRPTIFNGLQPGLIAIALIAIPFQSVTLLGLNLLLAIDRIRLMNALDAFSSLLLFINSFVVLVLWRRAITTLVLLNSAIAMVVCLLLVWNIARLLRHQSRRASQSPSMSLLREMLVYGLKFYVSLVASFVIFRADLLIVNYFRGADAAGVYAIASQFTFLLIMLPAVIASLVFPRVAGHKEEPAAYAAQVTRQTALIMLAVCLVAAAAAFALPLVYGARFNDATTQLLIMLPGVFLISLESVLVQYFTGTGLPIMISVFWIVTVIANLGLNLLLVPAFGARGAAVASTFSYALIFAMVAVYFCRQTRAPFSSLWLARRHA